MSDDVEKDWYFTFGWGQPNQGCYTVLFGTFSSTRKEMFDTYGTKWCMQYDSSEAAGIERWNYRRI